MHYGNFFVVNLCDTFHSSDGVIGQYHPNMLFGQVTDFHGFQVLGLISLWR